MKPPHYEIPGNGYASFRRDDKNVIFQATQVKVDIRHRPEWSGRRRMIQLEGPACNIAKAMVMVEALVLKSQQAGFRRPPPEDTPNSSHHAWSQTPDSFPMPYGLPMFYMPPPIYPWQPPPPTPQPLDDDVTYDSVDDVSNAEIEEDTYSSSAGNIEKNKEKKTAASSNAGKMEDKNVEVEGKEETRARMTIGPLMKELLRRCVARCNTCRYDADEPVEKTTALRHAFRQWIQV